MGACVFVYAYVRHADAQEFALFYTLSCLWCRVYAEGSTMASVLSYSLFPSLTRHSHVVFGPHPIIQLYSE